MACLPAGAKTALLILVMLVTGSYNTLNTKLQFQTCAPVRDAAAQAAGLKDGCGAGSAKFKKPWLANIFMFVGEASLLAVYALTRRSFGASRGRALPEPPGAPAQGLLGGAARKRPLHVFAIPAFCDVFGTGLASVGMLYMDSAIWQMLRSSIIIFSAVLSVVFLKRRLQPFHWVATAIVFVGLVIVGLASMLDSSGSSDVSPTQRLVGIGLVVGAQLCSAFQMVFEEKLLTGGPKTSAKKVVGMEGFWGGLLMTVILICMSTMPGSDAGHYESAPEGLYMIVHSPSLLALVPSYMCSIAVYNLTGIIVGKRMSAVVRCLVDSSRTLVVWAMNLFLYYYVSKELGAAWTSHAWLTVVGFAVLIVGTLLYNEVLPAPECLRRAAAVEAGRQEEQPAASSFVGLDGVLSKVDLTDEAEPQCASRCRARDVSCGGA